MMSGATEAALIRNEQLLVQQIIAPTSVNRVFEIAFADPERMSARWLQLLGRLTAGGRIRPHVVADLGAILDVGRRQLDSPL
jgi:hypothetical protein